MRRHWIAGVAMVGSVGLGGAIAACAIFTGSTDGYGLSADGATPEVDGACTADSGVCLVDTCVAASDCTKAGVSSDGAAAICCIGLLSSTTIGSNCETNGCGFGTVQRCTGSAECGGTPCIEQQCGPNQLELKACVLIPGCSIVAASDASTPEAGAADASGADASSTDASSTDSGSDAGTTDASDFDAAD